MEWLSEQLEEKATTEYIQAANLRKESYFCQQMSLNQILHCLRADLLLNHCPEFCGGKKTCFSNTSRDVFVDVGHQ